MKSLGISLKNSPIEKCNDEIDTSIELHINLWKPIPGIRSSKSIYYLDFGIMAKFITKEIQIYLPYHLKENDKKKETEKDSWEDLAHIMADNKPILCALFNEDYNISQIDSGCYHLVSVGEESSKRQISEFKKTTSFSFSDYQKRFRWLYFKKMKQKKISSIKKDNRDAFYLYVLGEHNITIKKCKDNQGSILKIEILNHENFKDTDKYYIRFRVALANPRELALETNISNNLIQAAFTKMDMYNIEINEKRDIPYGPKGEITAEGFTLATFSKIHLLYLSIPKILVENGNSIKSDSRLIEADKWLAYIPTLYPKDTYIAHHWKVSSQPDKSSFRKTNLFFTARYPKHQTLTILAYICVVLILGCLGSIIASLFSQNVTSPLPEPTPPTSSTPYDSTPSPIISWGIIIFVVMVLYIIIWCFFSYYYIIFKIKRKPAVKK